MSSMGAGGGVGAVGASGASVGATGGTSAIGGAASGSASVTVSQAISSAKTNTQRTQAASEANYRGDEAANRSGSHVSLSPEARALGASAGDAMSDLVAAALLAILLKEKKSEEGLSAYALAAIASYNAVQSMAAAPSASA